MAPVERAYQNPVLLLEKERVRIVVDQNCAREIGAADRKILHIRVLLALNAGLSAEYLRKVLPERIDVLQNAAHVLLIRSGEKVYARKGRQYAYEGVEVRALLDKERLRADAGAVVDFDNEVGYVGRCDGGLDYRAIEIEADNQRAHVLVVRITGGVCV